MKRTAHLFCAILLAASLVFAATGARCETVDRVVAVVNADVITLSELNAATAAISGGLKGEEFQGAEMTVETRSKALDSLIEKILIKQSAEKAGIEVSETEVDNAVEDIKKQNKISHEALLVALAQSGLTYAQYRNQLKEEIRQVKFANQQFRSKISIEDENIEEYYRQNIEKFSVPPSYRLRIIFLAKTPATDEGILKNRLDLIMEDLKSGRDFPEVAKEYSEGLGREEGGDIGDIESGELSPLLEESARRLKKGEISEPITAPDGIYIIQLIDFKDSAPAPLEKAKDTIKNTLYQKILQERYNFWLQEMKKIAHIEIRL